MKIFYKWWNSLNKFYILITLNFNSKFKSSKSINLSLIRPVWLFLSNERLKFHLFIFSPVYGWITKWKSLCEGHTMLYGTFEKLSDHLMREEYLHPVAPKSKLLKCCSRMRVCQRLTRLFKFNIGYLYSTFLALLSSWQDGRWKLFYLLIVAFRWKCIIEMNNSFCVHFSESHKCTRKDDMKMSKWTTLIGMVVECKLIMRKYY